MVDAKQPRKASGNFSFRAVCEFVQSARRNHAALLQDFKKRVPGDFPQRQDGFWFQDFQFTLEVAAAIRDLLGQRLVVRRSAPARRADIRIERPPASSTIIPSGARSHGFEVQSSAASIAPSATSMCCQNPPKEWLLRAVSTSARIFAWSCAFLLGPVPVVNTITAQ